MTVGGLKPFCAVILTAISVEYRAVREHLAQLQEEKLGDTIYERGHFSTNGQSWDVIIMETGSGNVRAALEAERAINFFKPNVILLVGLAGGLQKVTIGDVVVATKVYAYESGKAGQTFQARPEVSSPTSRLVQLARTEARKKDWLRRLKEPIKDPVPRVLLAPIASGGSVIASTQSTLYELVRSNYSDAVAIEREGSGFFNAIRNHPEIEALSIRGISDLIGSKRDADAAQETAVRHASAFAYELLAKLVVTTSSGTLGTTPASTPQSSGTPQQSQLSTILDPNSSATSTSSPAPSLPGSPTPPPDPNPSASSTSTPDPNVNTVAQAIVTQGCFETGSVEQKATSDMPAQTLKQDKLGFAIYVRAFRDFIASQDTSTPLTIGIYGAWGSGKSSLMHMIKNELDPPLDSLSKRWLRRLWWQWFRSYLWTLRPWLSAKLKLWRDDRRGRAQIIRNTYENQPATTSSQSSATSYQGNQPNNANNVGTNTATANQNSTDSNLIGQANNVAATHADPALDGLSSSPSASASTTNGHAGSTQHNRDDSRILDKIGGPRRFQKIREDLSYTPAMPQKVEDATELQKMRAGLSYDPSTTDKRLDDLTDPDERRWAKVAAAHCPMVPLTHPTIWFNAWKFDQEEQLWAALALEVMNQIKQKYGYAGRVLFWVRLTWKRSSHLAAFWSIIWKFVLPIVLLVITVVYTLYLTSITNATASLHIYDFLGPFSPKGPYAPLIPLILLAGAILSSIPAVKIIKDPFQIPVKDILDKPNYKDKVGFIGDFEKDFARIVSVATRRHFGWKPQKLVIFIDDLDRCEPPKAADIIEGINLFLDSDRCVFVLGMDPNTVAASIENKYKDLFEKIRRENTAVVSPGRLFLDKIIQVPFNVPPTTEDEITELMSSIMLPKVLLLQTAPIPPSNGNRTNQSEIIDQMSPITPAPPPEATQPSSPIPVTFAQIDRASYRRADIQQAINKGAKFLPENPRLVKKYMNLFRFYVYIADERGLLWYRQEGTDKPVVGLSLDRLAIWVAWSVRWAEIARSFSEEVQMGEIRNYLLQIAKVLKKDGLWCPMEEATKVNPNIFGHSTLIPMEEDQLNKNRTRVYEKLIRRINQTREAEKNAPSHWSHLPWEWWLLDIDFRKGIWEMQSFWQPPQNDTEDDWLQIVLTMTPPVLGT